MTVYTVFHAKKNNPFHPCMDGLFAAYAAWLANHQADVQLIAKQLGGGGHRNASGCKAMLPYRLATVEDKICQLIKRG